MYVVKAVKWHDESAWKVPASPYRYLLAHVLEQRHGRIAVDLAVQWWISHVGPMPIGPAITALIHGGLLAMDGSDLVATPALRDLGVVTIDMAPEMDPGDTPDGYMDKIRQWAQSPFTSLVH